MNPPPHKLGLASSLLLCILLSLFQSGINYASEPSASITLTSLTGKTLHPLQKQNTKASVIIFITTDCPIANALIPEINRIYDHYKTAGIQLTLAHVDPGLSKKEARHHAKDYALRPPIVIDTQHLLVKASQAKLTPQCAVFDAQGKLVYSGRINNQWADYGKRRAQASEHNLRDTLDAILAGKKIQQARTQAIGCYIPNLD
ncbi:MAG: redoxin family protein [Verrucomicrobiales bacterium]|nr:redoxin family protein [Verrucomicrobiales bacterium]